jgi:hypothetical protein
MDRHVYMRPGSALAPDLKDRLLQAIRARRGVKVIGMVEPVTVRSGVPGRSRIATVDIPQPEPASGTGTLEAKLFLDGEELRIWLSGFRPVNPGAAAALVVVDPRGEIVVASGSAARPGDLVEISVQWGADEFPQAIALALDSPV